MIYHFTAFNQPEWL